MIELLQDKWIMYTRNYCCHFSWINLGLLCYPVAAITSLRFALLWFQILICHSCDVVCILLYCIVLTTSNCTVNSSTKGFWLKRWFCMWIWSDHHQFHPADLVNPYQNEMANLQRTFPHSTFDFICSPFLEWIHDHLLNNIAPVGSDLN